MKEFIANYGMEIISAIVSALIGYIAVGIKKIVDKRINDDAKRAIAKTVVQAVEQIYKDVGGEKKLEMGISFMADLLTEKGIKATPTEIRLLIEDAVGEFNEVFKKGE